MLQWTASGASWSTASYPASTTANQLIYSSANNVVGGLATANNAVLTTNGSGVPAWAPLATDTYSQYALLAGRAGGQTLSGSNAASENLTLDSTTNGTKGNVLIAPTGGNVGIGTITPSATLDIFGTSLIIGGDTADGTLRTNATAKSGMITTPHYTNAEEKISVMGTFSGPAATTLYLGGGAGTFNAATHIEFLTSTNTTTLSGNVRMKIDNAGNVGIGTTTPTNPLHVVKSQDADTWIAVGNTDSGVNAGAGFGATSDAGSVVLGINSLADVSKPGVAGLNNLANTPLILGTNNVERVRITQVGAVGIGTTSPGAPLDVKGEIRMSGADSGYTGFKPAAAAGGTVWELPVVDGSSGQMLTTSGAGVLSWTTPPGAGGGEANTASNVGTAGVGVFKQKTGVNLELKKINVGSNKLSVTDDTGNSELDLDVVEANLTLNNIGGTLGVSKGGTGSTSALLNNKIMISSGGNIVENANVMSVSSPMRTDASGNPTTGAIALGGAEVSGTLPATKGGTGLASFAVGDLFYASSTTAITTLTAGTNGHVLTLAGGVPTWAAGGGGGGTPGGADTQIQFNNAGSFGGSTNFIWDNTTGTLTVTGDINYTGILTDTSDRRLKTDINPLDGHTILQKLAAINTYSFRMREPANAPIEYGVMAQEVETIFPEIVKTANDEMRTKSVNYIGFIAPLIEAFKQLIGKTDELAHKVDQNEADVKKQMALMQKELELSRQENAFLKTYVCHKDPAAEFCK
jgi:hypothetical protein